MSDYIIRHGVLLFCVALGAIVGVGAGVMFGYVEILASIGAAVGLIVSLFLLWDIDRQEEDANRKTRRGKR